MKYEDAVDYLKAQQGRLEYALFVDGDREVALAVAEDVRAKLGAQVAQPLFDALLDAAAMPVRCAA